MGHFADQYPGKTNAVEQTFFLNTGASDNFTRKFPFYSFKMLQIILKSVPASFSQDLW